MVSEYRKQLEKENIKSFNKFLKACNNDQKIAYRIHILWETSTADPVGVGIKEPKTKWQVFSEQAIREGFSLEQLKLFLLYSD